MKLSSHTMLKIRFSCCIKGSACPYYVHWEINLPCELFELVVLQVYFTLADDWLTEFPFWTVCQWMKRRKWCLITHQTNWWLMVVFASQSCQALPVQEMQLKSCMALLRTLKVSSGMEKSMLSRPDHKCRTLDSYHLSRIHQLGSSPCYMALQTGVASCEFESKPADYEHLM